MAEHDTLAEVRNHLYLRAEVLWQASLALAIATLVLTVVSVWAHNPFLLGLTGIAAVILPIAIVWIRESASTFLIRGDKCRRLILYADGLGQEIAPSDLAEVRAWSVGGKLGPAPFSPPYFSSKLAPGVQRLADIVTESAFFSVHLARKLQVWLWISFGLLLTCAIFTLYLADLAAGQSSEGLNLVAKSIAVFIGFLISGDFAILAKKYGDLRSETRHIYQRCAQLREDTHPSPEVVRAVIEDYNIALVQCPPIPSWLYARYRDQLNEIYRDSHGVMKG